MIAPASVTSLRAAPNAASWVSDALTTARSTSVRRLRLASVLARRTSLNTDAAMSSTAGSASAMWASSANSLASGHAAACTDPVCHHDHTSSVTNGITGANSRSSTDNATCNAAWADA